MTRRILIVLCIGFAMCLPGVAEDARRDGNWWRTHERVVKLLYVTGVLDGMELGNHLSFWGLPEKDGPIEAHRGFLDGLMQHDNPWSQPKSDRGAWASGLGLKKFGAEKVAGGLARIGGMLGPNGEVMHSSPFAAVSFGERDGKPARESLKALDVACRKAGIDGGLNDNINQDLWDKWIMLTSLAAMCCTLRGTTGDIMAADEGGALMAETVDECRKVAAAEGFDPGDKGIANLKTFLTQGGSGFAASMLGDLEKGGAIEGRHVIGDMLGRARKYGVAAPNLRMAYAVVQAYEARRARDGLGKPTK